MAHKLKGLEFFEPEVLEDCGLLDPQLDELVVHRILMHNEVSLPDEVGETNSFQDEREKDPLILP